MNAEVQALIELRAKTPPDPNRTLAERRQGMDEGWGGRPLPDGVAFEEIDVDGIPGAYFTPESIDRDQAPVLLWLHGGGYVLGSIRSHRILAAEIAEAAQARVLLIDYRLAPEAPFPAAVDDASRAYHWLLSRGISPERLMMGGDSAGGGLAVAALVKLRDDGVSLPRAAVLISPWVDMEGLGESMTTKAEADPIVAREGLLGMAALYLAGTDPRHPLAAPIYADLRGLPPLLIHVGEAETLLDDARRLAARAEGAGVRVTLEEWPGMIHVWHAFSQYLTDGRRAIQRVGEFVRLEARERESV